MEPNHLTWLRRSGVLKIFRAYLLLLTPAIIIWTIPETISSFFVGYIPSVRILAMGILYVPMIASCVFT